MTIETALIIGLIIAVIWLVYEYIQVHHKLIQKQQAHEKSLEITHKKSLQILDAARDEANKILRQARTTAVAHREKLSTKMDTALNAVAEREIADFKKALEMETISVEKTVGEKVAARYDEVRREVEDYKAKQIAASDQKINKVLAGILQKLLSKTINVDEHQKLVIKALEEAKQDGLFN